MRLLRRGGLGYLESPVDVRDLGVDALGLSALGLPSEASLEPHVGVIRNQGGSNTCVAQACAAAIDIRESLAGLPVVPTSRLYLYWHSRRLHGGHLADAGTYVRTAVKSLQRVGCPDEELWPWKQRWRRMYRRPGWEPTMRAHPRSGGSYYRIDAPGAERLQAIRAAIASNRPVVFGTAVTESFVRSDGPITIDRPDTLHDPIAGGHAMVVVGYDSERFRVLNSWGDGWRDGGLCWMTEDYMRWLLTRDLWIFEGWQRLQEAA